MKNYFKKHALFNLIKINLNICKISQIVLFTTLFFLFVSYKIIYQLNEYSLKYNLQVNFWDGIFKVITYPIIVLCVYMPIIIIATSIINIKTKNSGYILIRTKKRTIWIISKVTTNLFIGLLIEITFFLSTFVISYIFFGFNSNWSPIITNINYNMKLSNVLYLNNFVLSLTPLQSIIISFLEIFIATAIIINIREVLTKLITNIYICDLIVSMYFFLSIISFMYNLTLWIFKIFQYISLHTIAIISFHKFGNIKIYNITLSQSFIISIIFLAILVLINLGCKRKLVIKND